MKLSEIIKIVRRKREFKFSEVEREWRGRFWGDHQSLDKRIIESRQCPVCQFFLVYVGKSNSAEYRAYGVCADCDYVRLFWTENQELKTAKKSLMKNAA